MEIKDMANMVIRCKHCGAAHTVVAKASDFRMWMNGARLEVVMPYLSENDRQFLKSETCDSCWDKEFFPEEELFI